MAYKRGDPRIKEARRRHYIKHRGAYVLAQRKRQDALRAYIHSQKDKPCADCGRRYPYYVMDFDHLRDKKFQIGLLYRRGSWKLLKDEIAKCDVVCSNCHRIRTHERSAKSVQTGLSEPT
jgi:hypothetical protein